MNGYTRRGRMLTCLCALSAVGLLALAGGCGRRAGRKTPPPPASPTSITKQARVPEQAATAGAIRPLPEADKQSLAKTPQWLTWMDRLRGVYAALPAETRQQLLTSGRCEFKLSDLAEPEAKVIRDLIDQDPDKNIRDMLVQWAGNPPDLTEITFVFVGSDAKVLFGFKASGNEYTPAPIGLMPGK